jgi:hypothetical protein
MMLRPGKPKRARRGTVLQETFDLRMDQHDIFEIDRSHVVAQLRIIRRAIDEGAEEMEMVAIEKVFVNSVSQALTRTARKLYQLAEELSGLHRMVERASLPKEPERASPESRPRARPKRRN